MTCGFQILKTGGVPRGRNLGCHFRLLLLLVTLLGGGVWSIRAAEGAGAEEAAVRRTFGDSFRARRSGHAGTAGGESLLTSVMTDFYDVSLVIATVFWLARPRRAHG